MAKSAYQLWQEEQARKQKEAADNAASGQINYKEAAKTSRVQYTTPNYQGKSKDKSYKWEENLSDLKFKGARSNNDKFKAWARVMGLTDGQAEDFRNYLDFGEDSKAPGPKLNKDKSVNQNSSVPMGQGATTQVDRIDAILNGMKKNMQTSIDYQSKLAADKAATPAPEQQQSEPYQKTGNKFIDGVLKVAEIVDRPGDAVRSGIKNKMEGGGFLEGAKAGFTGKMNTSGSELNKKFGFNPEKDSKDAAIAKVLGDLGIGASGATATLLSSLMTDETKKKLGTELAGLGPELLLDPLNLIGTGVGSKVAKALGKGADVANRAEDVAQVTRAAETAQQATDPLDYAGRTFQREASGDIINPNAPQLNAPADEVIRQLTGRVDEPQLNSPSPLQLNGKVENPTNELVGLNEPLYNRTVQGLGKDVNVDGTPQLEAPKTQSPDPLNRGQQYWQGRYEDFANAVREAGYTDKNLSPEAIQELWTQFARNDEPLNINQVVDLAYPKATDNGFGQYGEPLSFKRTKEFGVNKEPVSYVGRMDPKDQSAVRSDGSFSTRYHESPQGDSLKINPEQPLQFKTQVEAQADPVEELLRFVTQVEAQPFKTTVQKEVTRKDPVEILNDLKNVKNSQDAQRVVDELIRNEQQSTPSQAADEVAAAPETDASGLRMNLQYFNPAEENPLINVDGPAQTKTAIESITNPIKRFVNKFYEGYVNRNHGFKVAEMQALANQIKDAKAAGNHDLAKQLAVQLKNVKKYGSDLEKAVGNEAASAAAAKNFLDTHMARLAATVGGKTEEVSKALEYQMAKNLDWIRNNGKPDYELPEGWDWERVVSIINQGDANPKYVAFTDEMRNLTQEWRDVMRDYGLVNEEAYKALGENPFYVPMARELNLDNIDAGIAGNAQSARRKSSPGIVHALHNGDVETFYKNPIETIMKNSFVLFKNAYRNDTAQQAYRLAEMDTDGMFAKVISKKQFDQAGGLEVSINGKKQYVRLQDDLMKALKENEQPMDMNNILKATRFFAYLKTTSIEYQVTAAPRDMIQSYLTSQVNNPVRYFAEVMKAVKNKNADAKKVGAYFEHAYNEHTAGMDPNKITQEYAKQSGMTVVKDKKTAGELVKTVYDFLTTPARKLGQLTDDIPRDIEVRETERIFMKKHGDEINNLQTELNGINQRLAQADQATDPFDPSLQGIDDVRNRKAEIEGQLRQFQQYLKREQIYRGRDVINYSRAGRGGVAKDIRKYIIFANTTTQSKDKVIRSFIERPAQTIAKTIGLVAPVIAAEKMMHDSMSDSDKEVYDGLPDYTKQFNYIFVKDGKVIALPKLQELALISNPIEAALKGEDLNDSMRLLVKESVPYQGGMIAQGFVPNEDGSITPLQNMQFPGTIATPGAEVLGNNKIGFNQKPISFGAHFKGADAKANDWTLDLYKKALGNNPNADYVQYLTQQYGGDMGKYGNYSLDWLLEPGNTDKLDAMLENLNPLQDRYYAPDNKYFKSPPQESRK